MKRNKGKNLGRGGSTYEGPKIETNTMCLGNWNYWYERGPKAKLKN